MRSMCWLAVCNGSDYHAGDGPNEFVNLIDPEIQVFNPAGTLIPYTNLLAMNRCPLLLLRLAYTPFALPVEPLRERTC